MTQERLADLLQTSNATVSNWEKGGNEPNIDYLINLCDIFKTDLETLIRKDAEQILGKLEIVKGKLKFTEGVSIANEPLPTYGKPKEVGILEQLQDKVEQLEKEVRRLSAALERIENN
jgi:transcriptional regulator with XRE-family HTH domain